MSSLPDKVAVRDALVARLQAEAAKARDTANATRAEATHEEARPENDKDTRALEQTYLARGQAMRVEELEEALVRVRTLPLDDFSDRPLGPGALVLCAVDDEERIFFVAPAGGGEKLEVAGAVVHVLTAASPVGRALAGKRVDDDFELRVAGRVRDYEVLEAR